MLPAQKDILRLFAPGVEVTLQTVVANFGRRYYCHPEKYLGQILGRMVQAGILERIRPGVFLLTPKTKGDKTGRPNPAFPF